MSRNICSITLNDGSKMPLIGLGTANAYRSDIIDAACYAVDVGYRHFDGALFYANEPEVGEAIRHQIEAGKVQRKDLYIVSKLWCTFMSPSLVESSLRKSLADLQLDYLDLCLMHWPMAFEENQELIPNDENGRLLCKDVDYLDTWRAMEECVRKGLTRSIGVSNFNSEQMIRLLGNCTIKPVTNQIEVHPYLTQKPLIKLCKELGVVVTAYGPLGRPGLSQDPHNDPIVTEDPVVKEIATKHSRSVSQVLLRYLTMQNLVVIPKSANKSRILENIESLDFELSEQDLNHLDELNRDYRILKNTWASHHPRYPFNIPF